MTSVPHSHLAGIAAFVQSVDLGGFTAAADRMGLSKSAVAKSVARLEERLGVRLLNRTTRRFGLTVEGASYYETCLKVLSELDVAESLLASRKRIVSGVLRVTLPATFGPRWAVPMLLEIAKAHPQLQLELSFTDRHVDLVEEGFDLAVRIGELGDSASLVARSIGFQSSLLCGSPAYFSAHGEPQGIDDLNDHVCLGETRSGRILPWVLRDDRRNIVDVAIAPRHVINSGEGLLNAALAGAGIAQLPGWLANGDIRAGRLRAVLVSHSVPDRPINLVWPHARDVVPKVRVVVDFLLQRFLPRAPWELPT